MSTAPETSRLAADVLERAVKLDRIPDECSRLAASRRLTNAIEACRKAFALHFEKPADRGVNQGTFKRTWGNRNSDSGRRRGSDGARFWSGGFDVSFRIRLRRNR
jgi:hypothetical protein